MENAGLVIAISAVLHGLAIGAIAVVHDPAEREVRDLATPRVELMPIEPVEVVVLSAPEMEKVVAVAEPVPSFQKPMHQEQAPTAKRSIATTRTTQPETVLEAARAINPLFAMRGSSRVTTEPPRVDLRLPRRDPLERVPRGTDAVVDVPESGELAPSGGGTYRSDKGAFTARVNKDGTVDLENSRNLRIGVPDPRKVPKALGDWAAREDKTPGDPDKVAINSNRSGDRDTRPDHGKTHTVVRGGFDVTDALMRRKKIDPYAAAKLRYLDSTRDERVQIGNRYKREQLLRSAQLMQKQIDLLRTTTPAQQKQALFELWDDCAETGSDALVEGGRQARALVVGYIRTKLVGDHAYTAAELAAFNKRKQSKAAFEPYR